MLRYVLAFIVYFGGGLLLNELEFRHDRYKENLSEKCMNRAKRAREFKWQEDMNRIAFLLKLKND